MFVNNHYVDAKERPFRDTAAAIIDLFEDILDENNITIPDEYRQGDPDEARIYGDTYYALENSIEIILERLVATTNKYKTEYIKLVGLQDRRRKLTDEQKEEIREKREQGKSLNALAKEYNVSRTLILITVNPESKTKSDKYAKDHWRKFRQSPEHCREAVRKTRRYRQELMTSGKFAKEQ